jgi:hypothetical protein
MADIQYSQTNNICFNDNLGNIIIDQINFSEGEEEENFASFNIQWSGDLNSLSQISEDGRIVEFLSNGYYSFSIVSSIDGSVLGPFNSTITSPSQLSITDVKYNKYACSYDGSSVRVYISGGTPPYSVAAGGIVGITSENNILLSGVVFGNTDVVVIDANNCSATFDKPVTIFNSIIDATIINILPPKLYDSYGLVTLRIVGYGPFNLWFTNTENQETTYVDGLSTEYIFNIINDTEYYYRIDDKLVPGNYTVTIKNNFGCSAEIDFFLPNTAPMSVNMSVFRDDTQNFSSKELSLPIFDTILIPYKNIQNNTNLWQLIKKYSLKSTISFKINDEIKQHIVVRNMLDKYCLDENKIEILRLGNSSEDWFYYFYIAPSVNLVTNPKAINSVYEIFDPSTNESYKLTLGLDENLNIDTNNPSLIKGSFLLNGLSHNQFVNNPTYTNFTDRQNNIYLSFDESPSNFDYDFFAKNTSKKILKNTYAAGYITAINFLEQFNKLNAYVDIRDTACNLSLEDYQYILQIKDLLKSINNFNNINSTYVFNIDTITNTGQIILSIDGQSFFDLEDGTREDNLYSIKYYTFDEDSTNLSVFIQNNNEVNDISLKNVSSGYVIIKIKDKYQNTPKNISINNVVINYDPHFIAAKNIIQKFNSHITQYFSYGDILCYISSKENDQPPINDTLLPQPATVPTTTPSVPIENPTIQQTKDITNTASLTVNLYKNITCILYGPKNYQYFFNTNTTFTNMIPGVYRIVGNNEDLLQNSLYPQEFRIIIDKNTSNVMDIDFVSYRDKVFIKETK